MGEVFIDINVPHNKSEMFPKQYFYTALKTKLQTYNVPLEKYPIKK